MTKRYIPDSPLIVSGIGTFTQERVKLEKGVDVPFEGKSQSSY